MRALGYFRKHHEAKSLGDGLVGPWIQAGAAIGKGSDSGSPLNFHRDALWREAKVFIDHGTAASKVVSALTLVNAQIHDQDCELGTIEPGKLADVAVIRGDPLFDIVELSNVDVVVKRGIPYRNAERIRLQPAANAR